MERSGPCRNARPAGLAATRLRRELDAEAPLWINLANDTHYGQPLGYQGIAGVCKKYLGTSKVHITRHTFALLLQELGAKLTDIQRLLGHKNAAVTSLYLE